MKIELLEERKKYYKKNVRDYLNKYVALYKDITCIEAQIYSWLSLEISYICYKVAAKKSSVVWFHI